MTDEEILEEGQKKLEDVLTESIGRFEARRMVGLFFSDEVLKLEGKSVAAWLVAKAREPLNIKKDVHGQ